MLEGSQTLKEETVAILREAHEIAVQEFGEQAVAEIPRLATDVAIIMATLSARTAPEPEKR